LLYNSRVVLEALQERDNMLSTGPEKNMCKNNKERKETRDLLRAAQVIKLWTRELLIQAANGDQLRNLADRLFGFPVGATSS